MSKTFDFHRALGRLAKTNSPPSTQDATLIHEIMADIEKKAAEARSQLQVLEQTLQDLDHERQFFKPLLSPMRRMPLEVLGEIFIQAQGAGGQNVLAKICQVCKGWREAAHLVPGLWTEVRIDPSNPTLSFDAVSSWIGHSRGLRRSLIVDSEKCGRADITQWPRRRCGGSLSLPCCFAAPVVTKILARTANVDTVTIICPTPQCFKNMAGTFKPAYGPHWDSIKSIVVDWSYWQSEWENIPLSAFTNCFPSSIQSLQLELPWVDSTSTNRSELEINIPPVTLRRLTSLNLTCDWDGDHLFRILQHCTNLETVGIDTAGSRFGWDSQDPFVLNVIDNGLLLQKLKAVKLQDVEISSMKRLKFLKIPSISDVDIEFGTDDWSPEDRNGNDNQIASKYGPPLASFLGGTNGSPSTLRRLRIAGGVFETGTLLNAFQNLSNLRHLTLENTVFPADMVTKISVKNLLPKLKSLKLLRLHINPAKLSGLNDFVGQRGIKLKTSRCTSEECEGAD